jgi:hypothetical protein
MDENQKRILGSWLIAALGVLAILVSAAAFGIGSDDAKNAKDIGDALTRVSASDVTASINYQGKLTDNASEPLSGTYTMIFRLYDVATGGTALDTDTHAVKVTDGLFNTHIDFNQSYFDGRELWLGITVGSDSEMMPRHELSAVPYALSLKPGAVINGSVHGSILDVTNTYGDFGSVFSASTSGNLSTGVFASTSGNYSSGVIASTSGNYSSGVIAITSGEYSDGVFALTFGNHSGGVIASTSGYNSDGIIAFTSGDDSDGVSASTWGDDSDGVSASTWGDDSAGFSAYSDKSDGIYGETGRSDHRYGVCTDDYMYALRYEGGGGDIAEYFAVAEDVEPGTVLIIGEDSKLQSSITAYDTTVAGIVSTAPGVSLGANETGNAGEKLIAVAGRVPCKVDASYASVKPGDLLTTSDTRGHAMKATNPQIGTILGKALEPLESGTGVIEVLVTLQ